MLLTNRHSTGVGRSIRGRAEAVCSFPGHAEGPNRQLYVLVAAANVEEVKTNEGCMLHLAECLMEPGSHQRFSTRLISQICSRPLLQHTEPCTILKRQNVNGPTTTFADL